MKGVVDVVVLLFLLGLKSGLMEGGGPGQVNH